MITIEKIPWSFIKFSQLILKVDVWRSVWRICMWILGLKGLRLFLYNFILYNSNHVLSTWKFEKNAVNCSPFQAFVPGDVAKRCEQKTPVTGEVNCSPKPWIPLKTIVFSFSLRFFTFCLSNSNTMFSAVLINQGFVAQIISFSKYQYISCCPWSEVYMILAFSPPPHPPSHFLTSGYLPQTHDNSNCFWFPMKLSRVDCPCKWLLTYDDLIVKMMKFRGSISTYTCSGSLSTWFLVGLESATVSATPYKSSYFYCLT